MKPRKRNHNYTRTIALSFILVILLGTVLLCLPVSSSEGIKTPVADSFFTAVSATCVTGLVVFDTATYWSVFGQTVILCMIQIGGLGFMSIMALITMFLRRKISVSQRKVLMQSAGSMQLDGIQTMIKHIFAGTGIFELLGAAALSVRFIPLFGVPKGIYYSVFHSVSAFCNAGFDLMGKNYGKFSSFTAFADDRLVCTVLMCLIVIGGIGFLVWGDILRHGVHLKAYSVHSKVALSMTAVLILSGWILFAVFEWNHSLSSFSSSSDKLFAALFQSVTTRTAGFNTVDQSELSQSGSVVSMLFMLIGGCPGSTAGGIKTTTFAVVLLNMLAIAKRSNDVVIFKRSLDNRLVRQSCSVFNVYISLIVISSVLIMAFENGNMRDVFFETISAIGTVGLSTGITPSLSAASHIILAFMMYLGRIGGFSLILLLERDHTVAGIKRPAAKILIG
ncbi:MAG: TrkH family potassium uptake protein [Acutalibacteraceae bacterium]